MELCTCSTSAEGPRLIGLVPVRFTCPSLPYRLSFHYSCPAFFKSSELQDNYCHFCYCSIVTDRAVTPLLDHSLLTLQRRRCHKPRAFDSTICLPSSSPLLIPTVRYQQARCETCAREPTPRRHSNIDTASKQRSNSEDDRVSFTPLWDITFDVSSGTGCRPLLQASLRRPDRLHPQSNIRWRLLQLL